MLRPIYEDELRRGLLTYKDQLRNYYKYLAIFDLKPYVHDRKNDEIVERGPYIGMTDNRFIEKENMKIYEEERNKLSKSEINESRREIGKIIKKNSISNIKNLNETIFELVKVNDDFKRQILNKITVGL